MSQNQFIENLQNLSRLVMNMITSYCKRDTYKCFKTSTILEGSISRRNSFLFLAIMYSVVGQKVPTEKEHSDRWVTL